MNVESFNLDHTKVASPYLRLTNVIEGEKGDKIYKYDFRVEQPNENHMEMPALHSFEHMMAEFIRNHLSNIVDVSPMGCQTGFYIILLNEESYQVLEEALIKTLQDILLANEVPACNIYQCGWAKNHSLEGAKKIAEKLLLSKDSWNEVFK